jgi:glycosyltransferase involved in cell wall biosynthesis
MLVLFSFIFLFWKANMAQEKDKLVSVIVPIHNSEKTLRRAIDSILSQTYENIEVLLILDHCSDNSEGIAKSYFNAKVSVLTNTGVSGAAQTRNAGISYSHGFFLAFLDSDDAWAKDKLKKQIAFMNDKDCYFSYTDYWVCKDRKRPFLFKAKRTASYDDLLRSNFIGCSTVIVSKEHFPFFSMPERAVKREDLAAWLLLLRNGEKALCLSEPLTFYYLNKSSVSSKKTLMLIFQWRVYRKIEKLSCLKSLFYLLLWSWHGFWKYK